jgi:HEAT repeat protein
MTFEEIRLLIPQYLSGQLTPAEKDIFEAQLSASPELRIEVEELRSLWEELGSLPQEQPSDALRTRFYQKLNAVAKERSRSSQGQFAWWKPGLQGLVRQTAIAVAVFALGMYVGRVNFGAPTSTQEVKRLDTEVQTLRQTVALSLLDRQSPTSRLQGISWSGRVEHPDRDLVSALLSTLNSDPNINVRLSALDAVEKFSDDPGVRKALVESIPRQDSPLVQIALIDAVVHMHDHTAAGALRKLTGNADANAAVRQRAQWGLEKLSYQ